MRQSLGDRPSPCAVVDRSVVENNCARMSDFAARAGVQLRPHVKTHKCIEAARISTRGHFGGITVSTLAEAEHFAAAGFDDITYAVPIAVPRIPQALDLTRRVKRLGLLVDHRDTVSALADSASAAGTALEVLVKVDCGYHRAGVEPHRPEAHALVEQVVGAPALRFEGLLTHAGHSYACRGREAIARVAAQERDVVVGFAEQLRAAGIEVPTVSVGSTPTMSVEPSLAGVTEIRPGNYVFYDAFQAAIGSCSLSDCAFSVLATIIGLYPHDGRIVIDAGALALSKDLGATHIEDEAGYGVVCDEDGAALEQLSLVSLSQEHGVVRGPRARIEGCRIGDRIRVIANHSCLAAACHDAFVVARGRAVEGIWSPVRGW